MLSHCKKQNIFVAILGPTIRGGVGGVKVSLSTESTKCFMLHNCKSSKKSEMFKQKREKYIELENICQLYSKEL